MNPRVAILQRFRDLIPPLGHEERAQLTANILADGCRDPVVVWPRAGGDSVIVDGHNRVEICEANNVEYRVAIRDFASEDEAEIWIIHNQFGRRNLAPFARAELALRLEPMLAAKAKAREIAGTGSDGSGGRGKKKNPSQNSDEGLNPNANRTSAEIAKVAGLSRDTIDKAKFIRDHGDDSIKAELRRGDGRSINAAVKDIKASRARESVTQPVVENCSGVVLSDLEVLVASGQKFGCIYADPPWAYANQSTRGSTDNHYETMTVEQICAMPISNLAADAAHLHLWTTNAFLFECPKILEAWGFEFRSTFVWVKPQMGMGNYWRNSHEIMVLGIRGGLTAASKSEMSWIEARRGRHSAKPQQVRERVMRLSPGPYLELFGRRKEDGWTVFGNQVEEALL